MVHRLRSAWSLEAKLVSETLDDMHLEPAWVGNVATIERFGQVGTMPVRGFAPFVAVEDVAAGVTWAAQVAWSGSWQIELCRRGDASAISGGLADLELGHWRKTLAPDEVFVTPAALLTVAAGGVDECSQRLVELQRRALHAKPRNEADVPVMFNECARTGRSDPRLGGGHRRPPAGLPFLDRPWYDGEFPGIARGSGSSIRRGSGTGWRRNSREMSPPPVRSRPWTCSGAASVRAFQKRMSG